MAGSKSTISTGVIDLTLSDSDDDEADDSDYEIIPAFFISTQSKSNQDVPTVKQEMASDGSEMVEVGPSYKRARGRSATKSPLLNKSKKIKGIVSQGEDADPLNPENHKDAMKRAAAEQRQTPSVQRHSISRIPIDHLDLGDNAVAGPGPQTLALRQPSPETDTKNTVPSSHSHLSTSSHSESPKTNRVSPFQEASGEPGSFGLAVPMVKNLVNRPRATSKPVSSPAPGDWGNSVPIKIGSVNGKARETSLPSLGTVQKRTTTMSLPVRHAQSFLPNPIPYVDIPSTIPSPRRRPTWTTDLAADTIDQIFDSNTTGSGATGASVPIASVASTQNETAQGATIDRLPVTANSTIDLEQRSGIVPLAIDNTEHATAAAIDVPLGQGTSLHSLHDTNGGPQSIADRHTPNVKEVASQTQTQVSQPQEPFSSDRMALDPTTLLTEGAAANPNLVLPSLLHVREEMIRNAIEVDEGADLILEHRAGSHETDHSFFEISAEGAMMQEVFASRSARRLTNGELDTTTITNDTVGDVGDDHALVITNVDQALTVISVPHDLVNVRESSVSTSASMNSPSKRQSNRLAARTETPVYTFKRNTFEPIRWRQTVELDGESIDVLLRKNESSSSPSPESSTTPPAIMIDGVKRTVIRTYDVPIIDTPPPPERASRAIRHFDTKVIDKWNKISPTLTHNPDLHRMIFQMHIDASVGGQEPTIMVQNKVDVEAIPPNFEFQYSNTMLYHDSAPEPELGQGCGCEGPCSEGSKSSCSCLKRQRLYNYDVSTGFAYHKDGTWKGSESVPIWECGPNCGCPPECMNRVIPKGRGKDILIDLFKTKKKGWGVKARSNIPTGTFIGIYSGELISEAESERRGFVYEAVGRTYLFDCDGWHIRNPPEGLEEVDPRLAELAYATQARAKQFTEETGNENYNAYSVDAFHYGFTRYFNHSCDPNLVIAQAYVNDYHPERPLLVIFSRRDIRANEELCISYKGIPDPVEEEEVERGRRYRKTKKSKTTSTAHVATKKGAKASECYCGAWNCDGIMFPIGSPDTTPER